MYRDHNSKSGAREGSLWGLRASPPKTGHGNWRENHKEDSFVNKFVIWIVDLSPKSKNIEVDRKLVFLAYFGQVWSSLRTDDLAQTLSESMKNSQKGEKILISISHFLLFTRFLSVVGKL